MNMNLGRSITHFVCCLNLTEDPKNGWLLFVEIQQKSLNLAPQKSSPERPLYWLGLGEKSPPGEASCQRRPQVIKEWPLKGATKNPKISSTSPGQKPQKGHDEWSRWDGGEHDGLSDISLGYTVYTYISGWWLSPTLCKMMEFVSWDDDSQLNGKMFQTTKQNIQETLKTDEKWTNMSRRIPCCHGV